MALPLTGLFKNPAGKHLGEASIWLAIVMIFIVAWCQHSWFFVFVTACALFYPPAICLHELGHALAVVGLGGEVRAIRLGRIPNPEGPHWSFRFFGFPCELHGPPYAGSVHLLFFSTRCYRTRLCLSTSAGPLINLLAAMAGIWFLFHQKYYSNFASLGLAWCYVQIVLIVSSMLPGRRIVRDGEAILNALSLPDSKIKETVLFSKLDRARRMEGPSLVGLTLEQLLAAYQANPAHLVTLTILMDKLAERQDPRKAWALAELADHPEAPPPLWQFLIDNYLTGELTKAVPADAESLDRLSIRLMQGNDTLTTRGTRGSILVHLGRTEEGKRYLEEVLIKTTGLMDKTYSHIFLAVAARNQNDLELAVKHARKAAELDPDCPALCRVQGLL